MRHLSQRECWVWLCVFVGGKLVEWRQESELALV